jgi:malonyl CoA-acyl carrier protein transacylase
MSRARPLDLAIVGMGCRSPGAPDLFAYWESLLSGRDSIPGSEDSDTKQLAANDPVAAALEDAGLSPDQLDGPRVAVAALHDFGRVADALAMQEVDLAVVAGGLIEAEDRGRGALVLRRRADAERDGDRIYAVVRDAAGAASIAPSHAVAAMGTAGLIRAALALHHRVLPPDLQAARPWIHGDPATPRRVGVKVGSGSVASDGLSVLEEHAASADAESGNPGAMLRWETEAVLLSASDRAGLADRVREVISWLEIHPDAELKDLGYTLNCADHDAAEGSRLGLVASSPADLAGRLSAVLARLEGPAGRPIGDGRGTYHWDEPLGLSGGLAFLFPGEGSQYPGMLADLCVHFPEVRRLFDTSDRIALELGDAVPPSEFLFGSGSAAGGDAELWSAPTAVNVVLSAQWALYQVLTRLGLRPDAVAGHSSGELLAMAAAGVLQTDRELERQLATLGAIFRDLEAAGDVPEARLVAVAAGRDRVEAACRAVDARDVAVAIDNCPHQVVIAGPPADVGRVVCRLRDENVLLEDLPFQRAYHTEAFAPVLGPVAAFFDRLTFRSPRIPVYSCATRRPMPPDPEGIRELAVSQWTRTVAFRETIEAMHGDGLRIFVDVGARGNLAGFVQDTLRGRPAFAVAANMPRRSGLTQLNHLVAALFAQGVPIRSQFLYARRRPRRIVDQQAHVLDPGPIVGWAQPADSRPRPVGCAHPTQSPPDPDAAMLVFQETMRAFLETQQAVIGAYLGSASTEADAWTIPDEPVRTTSGPEPGPWVGEVRHLVSGQEIESAHVLDAASDPIAEHHTLGGRRISALDPTLKGLPVLPFAVMAEMTAQAAALVVSPGLVLSRLEKLRAHRWVRYEDGPVVVELRGRCEPASVPGEERAWVGLYNRGPDGGVDASRPVFEAVAVFAGSTPSPPPAGRRDLVDPRPSRFTAESLYGEQWLFHGPAFRALVEVGEYSGRGIDGVLRVLPWEPLIGRARPATLHTDLIVIDSFTHLLGCWGLDELADRGDVVFPLRMEELRLYGERPPIGTHVACQITVEDIQRHRVRVTAEIVRPDGTVWMQLHDWEDWRFHWPSRYRDVFRQPQDVLIGEELPLDGAGAAIKAVWLAPPADMGRPVWRDVLEHTQLGPAERAEHLAMGGPEDIRSRRLWARIAAKEAARRLWRDEGLAPVYPADLAVATDERGRPILTRVDQPRDRSLPPIAIADADGVAVAIAARDPRAHPGIAVAAIPARPDDESASTPPERTLLARWSGPDRTEWSARFRCAREAAIRSAGTRIAGDRSAADVVHADATSGAVHVRIGATGARPMHVATARRGESVWAWTLGQGVEP